MNILLVDDDLASLLDMESILMGPDRVIFKAESGLEALQYIVKHDFALILLDIDMPKMDGFETALLIRQFEQAKHTLIIFISGMDTFEADVEKGFASGIVDFIFKPILPEILRSKVDMYVNFIRQGQRPRQ